jgi:PAS domain S-box-containing protein
MSDQQGSPSNPSAIPSREVDAILERGIRLVRERSDVVLNAVDDGIYVLDQQGHTIFANEAAVRMLGFTLREMLGRPQHQLIHHTHADGSAFPVEECPIYLAAHDGIYQRVGGDVFWRKDGRKLPVDYTSTPIKDGRTVVGAVVTFRDSSDHEQAQRQTSLLESERAVVVERDRALDESRAARELLEQVFDHVPASVSMTQGADHQIVLANARARELAGDRPIIGHTVREAFPELAGQPAMDLLDRVYTTGEPYTARGLSVRWKRADEPAPAQASFDVSYLPVRNANGDVIGVLTYSVESSEAAVG